MYTKPNRHGEYYDEFPIAVFLGDDPDLAFVHFDLNTWYELVDKFCKCDGVCKCKR